MHRNGSTQPAIAPQRFRRMYGLLFVTGLLVIWGAFFAAQQAVRQGLERDMRDGMQVQALVFEDHATRTLGSVAARLRSLAALTSMEALKSGRLRSASLRELLDEDPFVRSVSLVDDEERIIASSTAGNLGLRLPAPAMPPHTRRPDVGQVGFGALFPGADLADIVSPPDRARGEFWMLTSDLTLDGRIHHWVAAVDPGFFRRFWSQGNDSAAVEIALYRPPATRLVADRAIVPDAAQLGAELGKQVAGGDRGQFDFGESGRFHVAYRASPDAPLVLAVTGDRRRLWAERAPDYAWMLWAAVLASLLHGVVVALLFRWYRRYEDSMIESGNHARAIGAHLMVSESNPAGDIIEANAAFLARAGYAREEIIGRNHRIFNSGLHPREFFDTLWQTVGAGSIWKGTFRNVNKAGEHFWVNATIVPYTDAWGHVTRYVCFYSDISEAIFLAEKLEDERRLRSELASVNRGLLTEANTDALTRLSNRRGLEAFAEQALASVRRLRQPLAVLLLDLDRFKAVNDTHGHAAGDLVLEELARRWLGQVRSSDMLARLGGEEFCVILPHTGLEQAARVARKLCEVTAASPVLVGAGTLAAPQGPTALPMTVSIGVACAQRPEEFDLEALLKQADQALYEAKHAGRNRVQTHRTAAAAPAAGQSAT